LFANRAIRIVRAVVFEPWTCFGAVCEFTRRRVGKGLSFYDAL
jgi:hypothetical protein